MADEVPSPTPALENGPMLCKGDNQKGPIGNMHMPDDGGLEEQPIRKSLLGRAQRIHRRLPGINKIPLPAISIIAVVAVANVVVWAVAGVVLVSLRFGCSC